MAVAVGHSIPDTATGSIATTALTGTLQAAQEPAHTGDVTNSAGSLALAIGAGKVTLAMQANMATASVIYRKTGGSGAPEVQTLATLKTDLALTGTNSGDQTSIVGITGTKAQFNTAVTDGDVVFLDSTDAITGDKTLTGAVLITDGNLSLRATGDLTKIAKFDVSAIATGTTRTYQVPSTGGTFTLNAVSQTLTNKTLTTPKSTSFTVATLPAAATAGATATAFVTDGSVVLAGNSGNIVAGGGANLLPVYSDATNWRIQ